MKINLKRCQNCLMLETRPRISFDERGFCNACQWVEEKKKINWSKRKEELQELCNSYRSKDGNFDCIIPVSGGKDSSYVAYKMKHELGMHPLCLSIVPPLAFDIGNKNLQNFIQSGYDCLMVAPNPYVDRKISRYTMINYGQPLLSWITNVQVVVFKIATKMNIPLVMFGEEGETEYGGTKKLNHSPTYDIEDSIQIYLSAIDPNIYKTMFSDKELYWWMYPAIEELRKAKLSIAHWSYFENWDPYEHYLLAKEKCGLMERPSASVGTYNNFAQTDTCMHDLQTFFMYLKFGFGRCVADVGIDIRRGALDRKQAVQLARRYDGIFPEPYIGRYLQYFEMTREEFDSVIDKWANKKLFEKKEGRWVPLFEII